MTTVLDSPAESSALAPKLAWDNRFAALGPAFFTRQSAQPLPTPYWVGQSRNMARELGLASAWFDSQDALQVFSGNTALPGSDTMSTVYSGHQFGQWAGQLGDGRALLLGQLRTPSGQGLELQLKGGGLTPYSRMGDGRAVLRSSIREFLCSEAMAGLGIPTSRALCVTGSDLPVRREEMETAAVVTRVAPSFIRFGHFEHFSYSGQHSQLKALADFVIDNFYPDCRQPDQTAGQTYAALLAAVSERTAALLAQWQSVGFCHGVMNTDNMSILGLTIDYGPFQFLDAYDPGHICNHSDHQGRYAFERQPSIAHWNLFCLAQALLPLIGDQELALAALETYKSIYPRELQKRMRAKLGLLDEQPQDAELIRDILNLLAQGRVDFTIFWRRLSEQVAGNLLEPVRDLFLDRPGFDDWAARFAQRCDAMPGGPSSQAQLMLCSNPKFVLRNHLGEQAIRAAKLRDYSEVERLLNLLERPFDEHPGMDHYAAFPPDWAASIEISCSS